MEIHKDKPGTLFFVFFGLLSFVGTMSLYDRFGNLQMKMLTASDNLLFCSDVSIFYSLLLTFICIPYTVRKVITSKGYQGRLQLPLSLILLVVGLTLLCNAFFQYQNIGKNSIVMREGLISSTKHYDMEDVTSVHAYYQKGLKGALYLKYDLTLNDGKKIDAALSDEFYNKADELDKLLQRQGIHIERSGIKKKDQAQLEKHAGSKANYKVVKRILTGTNHR